MPDAIVLQSTLAAQTCQEQTWLGLKMQIYPPTTTWQCKLGKYRQTLIDHKMSGYPILGHPHAWTSYFFGFCCSSGDLQMIMNNYYTLEFSDYPLQSDGNWTIVAGTRCFLLEMLPLGILQQNRCLILKKNNPFGAKNTEVDRLSITGAFGNFLSEPDICFWSFCSTSPSTFSCQTLRAPGDSHGVVLPDPALGVETSSAAESQRRRATSTGLHWNGRYSTTKRFRSPLEGSAQKTPLRSARSMQAVGWNVLCIVSTAYIPGGPPSRQGWRPRAATLSLFFFHIHILHCAASEVQSSKMFMPGRVKLTTALKSALGTDGNGLLFVDGGNTFWLLCVKPDIWSFRQIFVCSIWWKHMKTVCTCHSSEHELHCRWFANWGSGTMRILIQIHILATHIKVIGKVGILYVGLFATWDFALVSFWIFSGGANQC